MPRVKSIDEIGILERLIKSGDKETVHYIKKLKESNLNQLEITGKAINRIRELQEENAKLKKQLSESENWISKTEF